jgi:tetratricopeptide (TPR) repeat protein
MKSLTIPFLATVAIIRLYAIADTVPAYAIHIDPPRDGEWGVLTRAAQVQFHDHRLSEAAESAKQALQVAKRGPSEDNRMATNYYQLGNIYRDMGHCADARTSYSRAIAVWEKQSSPKPKYLFNTIISMLDALCECETFDVAEKTFRKFEPKLQRYQSDVQDEIQMISMRGTIFRARKNYAQAETYFRRAIQLLEQTPGSNPVQIEEERGNLAMVIDRQGRHAESLAESERVIDFLEHSPVPHLATLAGSLNNAACSLADLGRKDEALRMFERALTVAKEVFGEDNRFSARIMLNYARVLRETKQSPEADVMQKKGVETFRRAVLRDNSTIDLRDLK